MVELRFNYPYPIPLPSSPSSKVKSTDKVCLVGPDGARN